jgi:tetratricopeptide (TPR) repeat protein
MNDWRAAADDYSYAIAINPKWAIPYNNRGYAYLKMKEYKKAKQKT